MIKLPKQLKATIAFVIASTINQGLTLLVTPIFVRIMSTEEIGIITNFNSWTTLISIIVNMVLYSSSYMIAMNEFPNKRYQYTSCALFVSMFSTIIFFIIYYIFSDIFENILHISKNLIYLMCLGFMFLPATNFWLTMERYKYNYINVLIVSVLSATIATLFSLYAVFYAQKNSLNSAEARLFGTYFINILIGILFSVYIFFKGKKIWDKEFYKFIAVVNSPMIIHSLAKNTLDISDRVMISALIGNSEAGIYGTLYSISTLVMIIWNSINISITPYMFSKMNKIDTSLFILKRFIKILLISFFMFSTIFTLIVPEIIKVFTTEEYFKAINIIPPIISGCFITSIYSLIGNILLYNKKTTSIMKATVLASIINILLNRIFIPFFGYQAAAYTTIIGYITLSISLYLSTQEISNKTSKCFDLYFAICIIIFNIVTNFLLIFLYPYRNIRYGIAIIIIFILIFNKKKFFNFLKY